MRNTDNDFCVKMVNLNQFSCLTQDNISYVLIYQIHIYITYIKHNTFPEKTFLNTNIKSKFCKYYIK